MRVALVFFSEKENLDLKNILTRSEEVLAEKGHHCRIFDGLRDDGTGLASFDYLIIGASTRGFLSRLPARIAAFFSQQNLIGKKAFVFTLKNGLRNSKAVFDLMKITEAQGIVIKYSEVLGSVEEAEYVVNDLHLV